MSGLLALELRDDGAGRTRLASRRHRFPLRTTVPFHLDPDDPGMAFVIVQNPTGGVFAGDELDVRIAVRAGARVHVTSQSATKLARVDGGVPGTQRTAVDVGPGAFVELMPDAVIPHAGARYRQRTDVELAPEAVLLCTELIAPGRVGEPFAYEELDLRTCVRRDGRELCADVLCLAPATWPEGRWGVVGAHGWLATMLLVAPEHDVAGVAADVDAALAGADGVLGAAAVLPGGCGVGARILGDGGEVTSNALRRAWGVARSRLFGLGLPPRRKG